MKKIFLTLVLIIVATSIILTVTAHSGKTDSAGGHIDNSTGEYHYHHGYSAHSHYDMDGDGDVDCPYDFHDQTGINSSDSYANNSYYSNRYTNNYDDNVIVKTETVTKTVTEEVPYTPSWVYWVIGLLIVSVFIMICIIRSKRKEISSQERQFQQKESRIKEGIANLHQSLSKKYGKDYLYRISNAPDKDYVDDDLLPHSPEFHASPYLDRYTFFLGSSPYNSSTKYHHRSCRYARGSLPVNAYLLRKRNRYQSCAVCSPSKKLPNTSWVDTYIAHYTFLSQYIEIDNTRETKVTKQERS